MPPDLTAGDAASNELDLLRRHDHDLLIRMDEKLKVADEALRAIIRALDAQREDVNRRFADLERRSLPTMDHRDFVIRAAQHETDFKQLESKVDSLADLFQELQHKLEPFILRQQERAADRREWSIGTRVAAFGAIFIFLGSVLLLFVQHIHLSW